jgi:hypothetical protein
LYSVLKTSAVPPLVYSYFILPERCLHPPLRTGNHTLLLLWWTTDIDWIANLRLADTRENAL